MVMHTGPSPFSALVLGGAKILYSCRTVPPTLQPDALAQGDADIRGALGRLVGSPLSDDDWRLASLGMGAGARSAREHAPAAYVASLTATAALSARIWPAFAEYDLDSDCFRDAESELRSRVPEGADIADESLSLSLHPRSPCPP